jgi:hypothetical protein
VRTPERSGVHPSERPTRVHDPRDLSRSTDPRNGERRRRRTADALQGRELPHLHQRLRRAVHGISDPRLAERRHAQLNDAFLDADLIIEGLRTAADHLSTLRGCRHTHRAERAREAADMLQAVCIGVRRMLPAHWPEAEPAEHLLG